MYVCIFEEGSNYTGVTLITTTPFYNFQLDNVFLKLTIGVKVLFT